MVLFARVFIESAVKQAVKEKRDRDQMFAFDRFVPTS
jgi:hypothetical protein